MSLLKKILIALLVVVLAGAAVVFYHLWSDRGDKYEPVAFDETTIPMFREVAFPFSNQFDAEKSLPIVASAIIDVDGDGTEEVFLGGGIGQADALMRFSEGKFVDIAQEAGLQKNLAQTTIAAAVTDLDHDGLPDLLVSREGAVYFYKNLGGKFAPPLDLKLVFNEKSEPASLTFADLNQDGWTDIFVSTYLKKHLMEGQTIFNKEGYGSTSQLFLNNGDNSFRDITKEAGLEYVHNTFLAVFADLDNDGLEDLAVAHDTGEPRIWRNLGNLKFELVKNPLTGLFSYPMGIAIGDYDNDGLQDLFFSNVGKSLPAKLLRGDLRDDQPLVTDWILLKNKGNMQFEDVAKQARVADYEFSWGAVFEDFNLDGLQDLVVAENYVDLPNSKILPLPSRFLMQLPDHTFVNVEQKNNALNPKNGITPLTADFNGDGYPDLVWVNLACESKAFVNTAANGNNYLKVKLPESPAYLTATVQMTTASGKVLTAQKVTGEGLASDQTHVITFGLGKEVGVKSLVVKRLGGEVDTVAVEGVNRVVEIR